MSRQSPNGRLLYTVRGLWPVGKTQRTLTVASFIDAFGNGLYLTGSALYFTRVVGMSVTGVGVGLTVGALVGLVLAPLVGHVADRWGAKEVHIATTTCGAIAVAGFVVVRSFWLFVVVACLMATVVAAGQSTRAPLIHGFGGDDPVRLRAYLRSVDNLGNAFGAVVAGIAIQTDTAPFYTMLIVGDAASFAICALVLTWLPRLVPARAQSTDRRRAPLRDRPFLTVTALNGIMSLHFAVLTFALPLWIVDDTSAPRWMAPAGLLVNTLIVAVFQVSLSRRVTNSVEAGRRYRWAGVALFMSVALLAWTGWLPTWGAVAVLLLAILIYTLGEVWQAAASFEVSFGLVPAHSQGQYAGIFGIGRGVSSAAGPALLGVCCLGGGAPGWLGFGALMVVVGFVTPAAVDWTARTRGAIDASSPVGRQHTATG